MDVHETPTTTTEAVKMRLKQAADTVQITSWPDGLLMKTMKLQCHSF